MWCCVRARGREHKASWSKAHRKNAHDTPGRFQPPQCSRDPAPIPSRTVSNHGSMRSQYADTHDSRNRSIWTNGHLFVHAICSRSSDTPSCRSLIRALRNAACTCLPTARARAWRPTSHPKPKQAIPNHPRASHLHDPRRIYLCKISRALAHTFYPACTQTPTRTPFMSPRFACTRIPTKDIIKPPTTTAQKGVSKTRGPPPPPVPPVARPLALPAATWGATREEASLVGARQSRRR